jgi:hypothetical protein
MEGLRKTTWNLKVAGVNVEIRTEQLLNRELDYYRYTNLICWGRTPEINSIKVSDAINMKLSNRQRDRCATCRSSPDKQTAAALITAWRSCLTQSNAICSALGHSQMRWEVNRTCQHHLASDSEICSSQPERGWMIWRQYPLSRKWSSLSAFDVLGTPACSQSELILELWILRTGSRTDWTED